MWIEYLEDKRAIQALYGIEIPELQCIFLHEVRILNGEDIQCYLRFDLTKLPRVLPEKWKSKEVNRVQLDINLSGSEVTFFNSEGGDMIGDIEIEPGINHKIVSFKTKNKLVFTIKTKWIFLRSITGHLKDTIIDKKPSLPE